MISVSSQGNHNKTSNALNRMLRREHFSELDRFGKMGVDALARSTPIDSGLTAQSWGYRIVRGKRQTRIEWFNTNQINGTPVVILIQYGHATRSGGYVIGRDFINPAVRPIFDQIADNVWKKVKS